MNMVDEKKLADWVAGNPYAAANEIERLRAALQQIMDDYGPNHGSKHCMKVAREALAR